jgi:hypothetical protein
MGRLKLVEIGERMEILPAFELESRLGYLDKLVADLVAGQFRRTTFQPWEVAILLDIQACSVGDSNKKELLKRYQKAAHRWFDRGGRTMLLLSDYLAKRHRCTPVNGAYAPDSVPLEIEDDELS